jgi:hypothetical protein
MWAQRLEGVVTRENHSVAAEHVETVEVQDLVNVIVGEKVEVADAVAKVVHRHSPS